MSEFWLPDTKMCPPAAPIGFGTRLYPQVSLFSSYEDIRTQLTKTAIDTASQDKALLCSAKSENYKSIRAKYEGRGLHRPYCAVCSELPIPNERYRHREVKFHFHHSTKNERMKAQLDHYGQYQCEDCIKSPHHYVTGARYSVLLSSSTLHYWSGINGDIEYEGTPIHMDCITIPGAKIRDLHQAVQAEYANAKKPVDFLICAGLNNILRDHSVDEIMSDYRSLKSDIQGWNAENTLAVCTLPIPPKVTYLRADPAYHRRQVQEHDRFFRITSLIPRINQLNNEGPHAEVTRRAPKFHTWGLRAPAEDTNPNSMRAVGTLSQHRTNQWRERNSCDQLHLSNEVVLRMGKSAIKYFWHINGMDEEPQIQPEAVEALEENLPQVVVVEEERDDDDGDTDDGLLHIDADPDELLLSSEEEANE